MVRARRVDGDLRRRLFARQRPPGRVVAHAQAGKHVYELRTYTAPDGKLGDLNARFRNHTLRIFEKHGMKNVLYMTPQDAPDSQNTLIYVLEHQSREAAKKSWDAFRTDPEWQKVAKDTTANGPITSKVVSVFGDPDRLLADEIGGRYDTHRGSSRIGSCCWSPRSMRSSRPPRAPTTRASPANRSRWTGRT